MRKKTELKINPKMGLLTSHHGFHIPPGTGLMETSHHGFVLEFLAPAKKISVRTDEEGNLVIGFEEQ